MKKFKDFLYTIGVMLIVVGVLAAIIFGMKQISNYEERHKYDKTFNVEYTIQSIRVDDDAQYHITAIKTSGGGVKSWHDLDEGWEVRVHYSSTAYPYVNVLYKDNGDGYGDPMGGEPVEVYLPHGYKIETFDD